MSEAGTEIKLTGLPELVDTIAAMQAEIDMLNDFVEDVLIMTMMPDNVRFYFEDRFDGRTAEAMEALSKHMHEHRKILEFLRINKIDVNKIVSDTENKTLS